MRILVITQFPTAKKAIKYLQIALNGKIEAFIHALLAPFRVDQPMNELSVKSVPARSAEVFHTVKIFV